MTWAEVRQHFPEQWLVIEALRAHSQNGHRILEEIAVMDVCLDGSEAIRTYKCRRQQMPQREMLFIHTSRETLEIEETGLRGR